MQVREKLILFFLHIKEYTSTRTTMALFTMEMTDIELMNLSYDYGEWYFCNKEGMDYEEAFSKLTMDEKEQSFNEYAEYLMNEEEMDDDELMTNMYAVIQFYGEEGYVFQDWYEQRTVNSADCVEYEEWKHTQPSAEEEELVKRYNTVIPKDVRLELKALNLTPDELYNFTNE